MTDLNNVTFFIRTFGCQMNENDSERIAGLLAAGGARKTERLEDAGSVIVNTCAVRGKSEEKFYSYLGRLRSLKKKYGFTIAVVGCVAQFYREKILEKNASVDFILGPDNYHRLAELLAANFREKRVLTAWSRDWDEASRRPFVRESPVSAYVTIMEGCNNFCAYCIVPFTRGRAKFRPLEAILDEIRGLARNGYKEIQFLGQNVNSYTDPVSGACFPELLTAADKVEGIEWIRFITSHPKNFSAEIVEAVSRSKKVCRQLHLPLQSGSTNVLERMKRGYSREDYLEKIRLLRSRLPEISLSTDIIVGFPGETEREFEETMDILGKIRFANIFSFRYSPRPRTTAARFEDNVPLDTKRRRLMEVQKLQKSIQSDIHKNLIGRTMRVLCLGRSKKDESLYSGRNEGYQVVNFTSEKDTIGRFVGVAITGCGPYSLHGELRAERGRSI